MIVNIIKHIKDDIISKYIVQVNIVKYVTI